MPECSRGYILRKQGFLTIRYGYLTMFPWLPHPHCNSFKHVLSVNKESFGLQSVAVFLLSFTAECKDLADPANGDVTLSDGTHQGSLATYSCDAGYDLSDATVRVCLTSGEWSGWEPTCIPYGRHIPHMSRDMWFPTVCHFDMCRLRRASAASFYA